jgi:hypothetical protein
VWVAANDLWSEAKSYLVPRRVLMARAVAVGAGN